MRNDFLKEYDTVSLILHMNMDLMEGKGKDGRSLITYIQIHNSIFNTELTDMT